MVAASTPHAAAAGVKILEQGGNAVDAAAAVCFALMVTDPPMTSLGGRSQTVIALKDGRLIGIDGATEAPAGVTPLEQGAKPRAGYQVAPIPGNPAALALAVGRHGRLPLAKVLEPAIALAEEGFAVTPRIAEIWQSERAKLAANPGAALNYLKPDGSAYQAGEKFRHPRLAKLLRNLASAGPASFYQGETAKSIAGDMAAHQGFLTAADLAGYKAEEGTLVRVRYRDYDVISMGRHGWGNTLGQMLNILAQFSLPGAAATPEQVELIGRTVRQALEDRPQHIGTLRPKAEGLPLELISSLEFGRERAALIRSQLGKPVTAAGALPRADHDTTHLSVMDAEGNAVAMTTSIGPRFGSLAATPELGFIYAHSYNMRSAPTPGARDLTEMTPAIMLRNGRPVLAVGAAGSERIPGAILQVISYVVDRGNTLERAVSAPRIFSVGNKARISENFPPEVAARLKGLGFEIELRDPSIHQHLGIVQAVQYNPSAREFFGTADPVYDGAAAGPARIASR